MPAIPSRGGLQFVTRCRYLTARCTAGCESWFHPRAIERHVDLGRCRGIPWVDVLDDSALVVQPGAAVMSEKLPASLIGPANVSQDRILRPRSSEFVRDEVLQGIVVRSPIAGIRARRWVYVVTAAIDLRGPQAIDEALTSVGFEALQSLLNINDRLVDCPDCGETVVGAKLNLHRTRSTLCRWQRARTEVRSLWDEGWRDPFIVVDAPQSWKGLQARAAWRRRIRTIEFPRWVAVLLSTAASSPVA